MGEVVKFPEKKKWILSFIIPDEISVDKVEDTYSSNFFSVELSDGSLFYVTADGEFIIKSVSLRFL